MRQVRAALPFIWESGLAAFEGGVLYLRGPKKKHCTPRYSRWFDEAPAEIFDRNCQKSQEHPEVKLTDSVKRLTESAFKPELELEPLKSLSHVPLPAPAPSEVLKRAEPEHSSRPEMIGSIVTAVLEEVPEGAGREKPESTLTELVRSVWQSYTDQKGGLQTRVKLLKRHFPLKEPSLYGRIAKCDDERLCTVICHCTTAKVRDPGGALYHYAVTEVLPDLQHDAARAEMKRILGWSR